MTKFETLVILTLVGSSGKGTIQCTFISFNFVHRDVVAMKIARRELYSVLCSDLNGKEI